MGKTFVDGGAVLDGSIDEIDLSQDLKNTLDELRNRAFGKDFIKSQATYTFNVSGNSFQTFLFMNLVVSAETNTNSYRLNADFLWKHDSAANDVRVRMLFNGSQLGQEMRVEPKDVGSDQRVQNNILRYAENLPPGTYRVEIQLRPASSSRVSTMFDATFEAWRVS